jgi:hypothetical protein
MQKDTMIVKRVVLALVGLIFLGGVITTVLRLMGAI